MMRKKARITPYASSSCMRMVEMRSGDEAEYYPVREEKRVLAGRRRFESYDQDTNFDPRHNPEFALDKKLDEAEFAVVHDTGPEGEAFRPGARLTYIEIQYMLKHESLSVNSRLVHVKSQRQHLVLRGRNGHLVLEPPYAPRAPVVAKNQPSGKHKNPGAISKKPCLRRRNGKQVAG